MEEQINKILASFNLHEAYSFAIENNSSSDLPYHNSFHTRCMIINCAEGAANQNLPYERTRVLLLSALFHDYDHSGGKLKDAQNIQRAIAGLKKYCKNDASFDNYLSEASEIIESTLFPPISEPKTLSQKIICDADQMQMYMPEWERQIFTGMRMEIEILTGKKISFSEMVKMQVKYMQNMEWHTTWAKQRAFTEWDSLIEKVKQLEFQA